MREGRKALHHEGMQDGQRKEGSGGNLDGEGSHGSNNAIVGIRRARTQGKPEMTGRWKITSFGASRPGGFFLLILAALFNEGR